MRQFRFTFIVFSSVLFVISTVLWRRALSVLLCGIFGFNSISCYSFLDSYGKADAAIPLSSSVTTSRDFSHTQEDKQRIAGCILGVCLNPPRIPSIPGIPGGSDPVGVAKVAITREIGEAVGVGSPLLLDQHSAYPDVSDQVQDFHPQPLTITSAEDLQRPLPPGDYSIYVIAYCTQFSIHAPGQGLSYKLAPLQGKQAPAIGALLSRGTLQNIAPATLNADAWRIQAGLPLRQWSQQDQALIHTLIPEYEHGLEGDYLQRIEDTYNQFRSVPGLPSFNDLLRETGEPGQLVLQLRQARQVLSDQSIAAERLPDMLYEPTADGLPRVLPASDDSSPSPWAEIQPGIFARFTVIEGNLGRNLLELRVTPRTSAAINSSATIATKELDKRLEVGQATTNSPTLGGLIGTNGSNGLIGYSIGRASQALISAVPTVPVPTAPQCANSEVPSGFSIFKSANGVCLYKQDKSDTYVTVIDLSKAKLRSILAPQDKTGMFTYKRSQYFWDEAKKIDTNNRRVAAVVNGSFFDVENRGYAYMGIKSDGIVFAEPKVTTPGNIVAFCFDSNKNIAFIRNDLFEAFKDESVPNAIGLYSMEAPNGDLESRTRTLIGIQNGNKVFILSSMGITKPIAKKIMIDFGVQTMAQLDGGRSELLMWDDEALLKGDRFLFAALYGGIPATIAVYSDGNS